jgi:hypothetical protein
VIGIDISAPVARPFSNAAAAKNQRLQQALTSGHSEKLNNDFHISPK